MTNPKSIDWAGIIEEIVANSPAALAALERFLALLSAQTIQAKRGTVAATCCTPELSCCLDAVVEAQSIALTHSLCAVQMAHEADQK